MSILSAPVISASMARARASETDQVNFRFRNTTIERMERFKERHPIRLTLTQIAEVAVLEWLERNEPQLPPKQPRR